MWKNRPPDSGRDGTISPDAPANERPAIDMPTPAWIRTLLDTLPYVGHLRRSLREAGEYLPGHYYSPVPSRSEVLMRVESMSRCTPDVVDIRFNHQQQFERLQAFAAFYDDLRFPERPSPSCRYYYDQTVFCYPDAIFLYSFLRETQPARIIEIGSGFSSAVMLDTIDRFFPTAPALTFVEPYPTQLNALLRPTDRSRVTIIEDTVQHVPVDMFRSLEAGDLLFIDSSHVLKCGSDLQMLLFEVIPRLAAGAYVHFHDIFQTFEYPEEWLRQGRYWNEAYFLRAFLANNSAWEIHFFNNYVRTHFEPYLAAKMPLCLKNSGGSLYLRKITD